MNIGQIEKNINSLLELHVDSEFVFNLLLAYGLPKASITRLRKGNLNLSKRDNEIIWKKKLLYKLTESKELLDIIDESKKDKSIIAHNIRFILINNIKRLVAFDTKTKDSLDIEIKDLNKHFDFFLPLAGMEKSIYQTENAADIKAAVKMANLFDLIKSDNPTKDDISSHSLNVFLIRLLFCFFAEDTEIFNKGIFTNLIRSHTQDDGSDLDECLQRLFDVLNAADEDRKELPNFLNTFPYVNGGLFEQKFKIPKFSRRSRQVILESGQLNWSQINPDIFGSMMQAVVDEDHRSGLGMHYTSVPNIMKVVEPLFLDELKEAFEIAKGNIKKLNELRLRISQIKIFDPACGSGNFLIITYKELRRLEMQIIREQGEFVLPSIHLNSFYGIEINDFACEVTKLSLWLAEHQMNLEFKEIFDKINPTLPLKEAGKIVNGNACRLDWEKVCPKSSNDEIYLLGNPPYVGYSRQTISQKEDMSIVFKGRTDYKKLDYIATWFFMGVNYIYGTNNRLAFVSTNSITQGIQVALLWDLLNVSAQITFAYRSFQWSNNAKYNAGVYVVILGLTCGSTKNKYLFTEDRRELVNNISPYLTNNKFLIVRTRNKPLSKLPNMRSGLKVSDNGYLILTKQEKDHLIETDARIEKYIKRYLGAHDFMHGVDRYCIWIEKEHIQEVIKIKALQERFEEVRKFRLKSDKESTRKKAATPYFFDENTYKSGNSLFIPQTGSEKRDYLPIGFLDDSYIISNGARMVTNPPLWLFSILSARMHTLWVKAVAGRLKMDMQYSNTLCYNTFPFSPITENKKKELGEYVYRILEEREKYSEKTPAQLYDSDNMPNELREAHQMNDLAVERCYRSQPFVNDEERLKCLLKMYEEMISEKVQLQVI